MDHSFPARGWDLVLINKKKKEKKFHLVDFAISALYRLKMEETEKIDKYLDLDRAKEKKEKEKECCGTWG